MPAYHSVTNHFPRQRRLGFDLEYIKPSEVYFETGQVAYWPLHHEPPKQDVTFSLDRHMSTYTL